MNFLVNADEERVLVLAPTAADAVLTRSHLTEAGLSCHISSALDSMCSEIMKGAGAILLTEEVLGQRNSGCIVEALAMQPHWSDIPVLLLTTSGADSPLAVRALDLLGNVTLLERPVRLTTLISSLKAALRARRRQYELRSQLQRLHEQGERLKLLWEAAAVLLTTQEPHAMLRELFSKIAPHFGLDMCFNFMATPGGDALTLESCIGIHEEATAAVSRLELGQFISGAVAQCRQPITATFIQQSHEPAVQVAKAFGIRGYSCNPLMAGERLLGTLAFASRTKDFFGDDELEFFQTVCHYVAYAYERLRLIRQLRDEDGKKDEFLATLAHELRNPLAPIRNAAIVLRLKGPLDADICNARDIIDRQVHQMTRLVDDLLDISRITRGKIVLQQEDVDLAQAVSNAIESSRPLIDEAQQELILDLPKTPSIVKGDSFRLAQVFANLLTNAAKYTDRGGRITLRLAVEADLAIVSVEDTGIGIAAKQLPHIFEMFSQVEPALERSKGGLGIGLALVRRLVEMHGGQVDAHSDGLHQGSTFFVRLPLAIQTREILPRGIANAAGSSKSVDGTMSAEKTKRMVSSDSLDKKRSSTYRRSDRSQDLARTSRTATTHKIVVADDNEDSARTLTMLLSLLGHEVRTAYDGQAAIEVAEEFRPNVMLIDIGMPKMNGYEAAQALRGKPWGERLVLVALTGWGQADDKRRAKEAGFDHHFTKPVDLAKLESLLT